MGQIKNIKPAVQPDDLEKFFIERLNNADIEGLLALYEPDAVMVVGENNQIIKGTDAFRNFFTELLTGNPKFKPGIQRPPILAGDIALTSALLPDGSVTAEVARRQADGTWRWIIDQPAIAK